MSVLVTFNGANYIIPETNEVGWGSNLTDYLVALAAGALQKTGGSFTLSAETDFGASFGLKSLYYKSRSADIATTGILRLANNSDAIAWRNFANSADLPLLVNASNQLTFNGTPIGGSGIFTASRAVVTDGSGNLTTSTTTAAEIGFVNGVTSAIQTQINAKKTIATGNAFKFETTDASGNLQETTVTASRAVATDANGLPVASATTAAELAFVSGVTSAIQTQINTKAPTASPTFTGTITTPLTANRALVTGAASELAVSVTTAAELAFVSGVTSAIQTQLNNRLLLSGGTLTGDLTFSSGKGIFWTDSGTNTVKLTAPTTITSTYTLKWPTAQGGSNQYLTNDGSGNLSWTNAAGTGTVNSGTQYQLAYYATSTNAVSGNPNITTNVDNQLLIADGTIAAPGLAFTADTNTGIRRQTTDTIAFILGGVQVFKLEPAGLEVSTTTYPFKLNGGTAAAPDFTFASDTDTGMWHPAVNTLGFATAGVDTLRLNVDFFPTDDATVSSGKSGNRWSNVVSAKFSASDGTAALPSYTFIADTDTGIYRVGANILAFSAGGVQQAVFATTSIFFNQQLTVNDGTAAAPSYSFNSDPDNGMYLISANNLGFSVGGLQALKIGSTFVSSERSLSGSTLSIVAENTSNTANSSAQLSAYVAGSAAGDAQTQYAVQGVTTWTTGIDNSISGDPWKLSASATLGTSDVLSITTAGIVTFVNNLVGPGSIITLNSDLAFASTSVQGIIGTTAAEANPAGRIGQLTSASATATNAPTSTQQGDLTSIGLTAGEWDISGWVYWTINGSTWTVVEMGISTTTGNSTTGLTFGDTRMANSHASSSTTPTASSLAIPMTRVSISATTTYYLKYSATYSAGTPQAAGRIYARRVR